MSDFCKSSAKAGCRTTSNSYFRLILRRIAESVDNLQRPNCGQPETTTGRRARIVAKAKPVRSFPLNQRQHAITGACGAIASENHAAIEGAR
jgi:hypothetical protein